MSSGAWQLVVWTLTLAAWLFVHVVALVQVISSKAVAPKWKWGSLFPPATPFIAWEHGFRVSSVLWIVLALLYVTLRGLETLIA